MSRPVLTLNQKLAAVALVLGALALFSQPHRGPVVKLDTRELAMIVEREVDHVTPAELAAWIVEGRSDYRLLDLRSSQDYAAYHIPTAENVPVAQLPEFPLLPTEKVVLYSEGGIHAAQAWMLVRAQGHTAVYTVLGVGFVVGGYCPGTSAAAVATGRVDGMLYALGIFAGTFVYAEAYPAIKDFVNADDMGQVTLPEVLGLPWGIVVFAVVLVAVLGFWGATSVERWMERRQ